MAKQMRRRPKAVRSHRRRRSVEPAKGRRSQRRPHPARATGGGRQGAGPQTWQSPADTDTRPAVKAGPVHVASLLLGAAAAMVIAGLVGRFQSVLAQTPASAEIVAHMVVAVAMLTLAFGVRVPQRFVVWVCTAAWRRFAMRGRPSQISGVLIDPEAADRPLFWVVLSVIALAAGVLIALLPQGVGLATDAYRWMLAHFLWSIGPLAVLQTAAVFTVALVPLTVLGVGVSCIHHLSCLYGRWETRATAWLLIGAAGALFAAHWAFREQTRGDLALAAAAIPALLTAVVSATSRPSRSDSRKQGGGVEPMPLPVWSDRWPTQVRASTVALACVGVWALSVWVKCLRADPGRSTIHVAAMLSALGLGVLAGSGRTPVGRRSIGAFGFICAAAGVVLAVATLATGETSAAASAVDFIPAVVSLAVVGFATACGWQTLLSRVAQRSVTGATILARMLVFGALIVWVGVPLADRLAGSQVTLLILALALTVLGAALILHEPWYSSGTMSGGQAWPAPLVPRPTRPCHPPRLG